MGDGSGNPSSRGPRRATDYPPVGEPDRYDMIVQRGRALRRRRRYTLGAGAGGTAVALAIAVVLITNGGSDDANATELAEGTPTTAVSAAGEGTTTSISESTTSAPMPPEMTVTIQPEKSTVLVQDPAQPVHDESEQCVYLRLTTPDDAFVAEGSACNTNPGPVEIVMSTAELGQACSLERHEPGELAALPVGEASYEFPYRLDATIAPGTYQLSAQSVSGVTDGCADTDDPVHERENVGTAEVTIELP